MALSSRNSPCSPGPESPAPVVKILNSWKEISTYIGRGVRTAQRYEMNFGLPIHRPAGKQRSSVTGFSDEIDIWLRRSSTNDNGEICPRCKGTGKIHRKQKAA